MNNGNRNITVNVQQKQNVNLYKKGPAGFIKALVSLLIDAVFLGLFISLFVLALAELVPGIDLGSWGVFLNNSVLITLSKYVLGIWWAALLFFWIVPAIPLLIIRFVVIPIKGRRRGGAVCMILAMVVPVVVPVIYFLIYRYINAETASGSVGNTLLATLLLFGPALITAIIMGIRYFRTSENL